MKLCILLIILTAAGAEGWAAWRQWKAKYSKSYKQGEEYYRRAVWTKTHKYIQQHNQKFKEGRVAYRLEANRFSDFGHVELQSKYTRTFEYAGPTYGSKHINTSKSLPKNVDWRRRNGSCVSPVQDQGGPGSCFAFSAIGALEGQLCIKTGKLTPLSVQQILDCDINNCGGYVDGVYDYIKLQKGIMLDKDYPYSSCLDCMQCLVKNPMKTFIPRINRFLCDSRCNFRIYKRKTTVKSSVWVYPSEYELMKAVATIGPIAAGIDASHDLVLYSRHYDIYYEPKCSGTTINHAVLIVGYGTNSKNEDFWIVKNSWGEDWGNKGYFRMARNRENNCGIATAAIYPEI